MNIKAAIEPHSDGWKALILLSEGVPELIFYHPETFATRESAAEAALGMAHAATLATGSSAMLVDVPPTNAHCDKCHTGFHHPAGNPINAVCPPPCGGNIVHD